MTLPTPHFEGDTLEDGQKWYLYGLTNKYVLKVVFAFNTSQMIVNDISDITNGQIVLEDGQKGFMAHLE